MTAPTANGRPMNAEKLERELLGRLGLDASASPEDVGTAHEAVSAYLSAAPKGLRTWARTQAAGADEAYALLTDPAALARAVALGGAGPRPAVQPGGPATPPARRDPPASAPVAVPPAATGARAAVAAAPGTGAGVAVAAAGVTALPGPPVDEDGRRIVSDDEIDALLAEVDPDARPEIVGTAAQRAASLAEVQPGQAPRSSRLMDVLGSNAFRNVALVGATVVAVAIVAAGGLNLGGSATQGIGAGLTPSPAASAPVLDQAAVGALMEKIQANPSDADSLMALGDEYYKARDFATAADWFEKVTTVETDKVRGFLALGAAAFNGRDLDAAEAAWNQALAIDDTNVEGHYDLGFLYLNQKPPDMDAVKLHWNRVVELAPDSDIATTVKAHLGAFASFSPDPGAASPSPGASGSPATSPEPSGSPAATPATSPAASAAPSALPAPTASP